MKKQTIIMLVITHFLHSGLIIAMQKSKSERAKFEDRKAILLRYSEPILAMQKSKPKSKYKSDDHDKFEDRKESDISRKKKATKKIIKTLHVKDRMIERSISNETMEWVIRHGDQYNTTERDIKLKVCTSREVAVIFDQTTKTIITAYPMNKDALKKWLLKRDKKIKQAFIKNKEKKALQRISKIDTDIHSDECISTTATINSLSSNLELSSSSSNSINGSVKPIEVIAMQKSNSKKNNAAKLESKKEQNIQEKKNVPIKALLVNDKMMQPSISNSTPKSNLKHKKRIAKLKMQAKTSSNDSLGLLENNSINNSIKPIEVKDFCEDYNGELEAISFNNLSIQDFC